MNNTPSKRQSTAFILAYLGGAFGLHRFYLKETKSAVLYLFTLGLLGIGALVDMFRLAFMDAPTFAKTYNNDVPTKPLGLWAKVLSVAVLVGFVLIVNDAYQEQVKQDAKEQLLAEMRQSVSESLAEAQALEAEAGVENEAIAEQSLPESKSVASPAESTKNLFKTNCKGGLSDKEIMFCQSQTLLQLEKELAAKYQSLITDQNLEQVLTEHEAWVATTFSCETEDCLINAYRLRMTELSSEQE